MDSMVKLQQALNGNGEESATRSSSLQQDVAWSLTGRATAGAPAVTVDLVPGRFRIGRRADNNLCIPNDSVSGRHAELLSINDQLFLADLKSTNGTRVNGRRVESPVLVGDGDIIHFGNAMYTVAQTAGFDATSTLVADIEGDAIAQVLFRRLLTESQITPWFQPIVRLSDAGTIGFEALARSRFIGLKSPDRMFRVASEHGAEQELSRECRRAALRAVSASAALQSAPCYLNTHPAELDAQVLSASMRELRERYPEQPMTLEIHESAIASVEFLRDLRAELNALEIRLAYDDFGAGQTRLMELVEVPPDVVKFDARFIRGLPTATRQRMETTKAIVKMVKELGAVTLAEGVETQDEADACATCGFEFAQGYLFGRPAPADAF